jgi:hypothetical protein
LLVYTLDDSTVPARGLEQNRIGRNYGGNRNEKENWVENNKKEVKINSVARNTGMEY